jgi:hypothetical protein
MEVNSRRENVDTGFGSLERLQEALVSGKDSDSNRRYLNDLQRRLVRVRSLGGQFGKIDFSPEVKAMLGRICGCGQNSQNTNKQRAKVLVS